MKPSAVADAIKVCVDLDKPLFIWGAPGVGKSDTVRQAAAALGLDIVDFRAALRDAVDIMGLPYTTDTDVGPARRATNYALPAGLPRAGRGILFLDEMNSAPPQTQAALYQLVLDRRVGDYELPKGWHIVAAGNRTNDRGVVHRMPDPLVDRFFHVEFEPDMEDWCTHATAHKVRPEVVGYIRFRPAQLHEQKTDREKPSFSTPRGWFDVSAVLEKRLPAPLEADLIRGRVGMGAGSEFLSFLKLYREMISPEDVIKDPRHAPLPDKVDIKYALSEALARRATVDNIGALLIYARRMDTEYAMCMVSSAGKVCPEVVNTVEYVKYVAEKGGKKR